MTVPNVGMGLKREDVEMSLVWGVKRSLVVC